MVKTTSLYFLFSNQTIPETCVFGKTVFGLSLRRVQDLITDGRLPAQKIGNSYVINEKDLELVKERTPGRPSNKKKTLN